MRRSHGPSGHSRGHLLIPGQPEPPPARHRIRHPWEHRELRSRQLRQNASDRLVAKLEASRLGNHGYCRRCSHLLARVHSDEYGLYYTELSRTSDGRMVCTFCGHDQAVLVSEDQTIDPIDTEAVAAALVGPKLQPKICGVRNCAKVVDPSWVLEEQGDGSWSWRDDRNVVRHFHPSPERSRKAGLASAAARKLKRDKGARERHEEARK